MAAPFLHFPIFGNVGRIARPLIVSESLPATRSGALDALVSCARSGDAGAFRQVTEHLAPELLAYVRRRLAVDLDTARDVVQEAFVLAWCNLDQIRDDQHLRPWLFRVARYRAVTWIRRRGPGGRAMASLDHRRELGIELGADPAETLGERPAEPMDAHASDEACVTLRALRRAIRGLKPSYREVVRLHYLRGLDTRETAHLLGVTRATVKMRLFRARHALRRLMHESDELPAEDAEALRRLLERRPRKETS